MHTGSGSLEVSVSSLRISNLDSGFQRMLVEDGSERETRDPLVTSPSFSPMTGKTKDVQSKDRQVNRHLAIKTPSQADLRCRPFAPDRIGLSSFTYSLKSLAPAPRTGPDQGSLGAPALPLA